MMKRYVFFCFSCFIIFNLFCQNKCDYEKYGWFVPVYFCQPFVSEIESPLTKIEEGFGRARAEYTPINNKKRKYLPYLNVDLGVEIPVWSMKLPKDWYIAVDFPVDFHLWLDLQTLSAPVIDTDYRFAVGQIKALKIFHDKYINNLSIRLAPYNHESTHIGDELTIRRKDAGYPITRVNVSYEYTELAVCLNDPVGSRLENHALKAGMMLRMPLGSNWFKIYTNEGDPSFEVKMKNSMEYYLEYEWQRSNGLLTWNNINNILSVEIRNRAKYKYPSIMWNENKESWYALKGKHSRAFCINVYYGWKFHPKYMWLYNSVGFYFHGYYGIVPYGQFRNTGDYGYLGISLVVSK